MKKVDLAELIDTARVRIMQDLIAEGGKGFNSTVYLFMQSAFFLGIEHERNRVQVNEEEGKWGQVDTQG